MPRHCQACGLFRETKFGLCDRCRERLADGGDPRKAAKAAVGTCVSCGTPDIVIGPLGDCAECAVAAAQTEESRRVRDQIARRNDLR